MPYIKEMRRADIYEHAKMLSRRVHNAGELNFAITQLLLNEGPKSYEEFNRLIGVLECCKLEFYRRAVVACEEKKIAENGDVY